MSSLRKRFSRKPTVNLLKYSIKNNYHKYIVMVSQIKIELNFVMNLMYQYVTPPDPTLSNFTAIVELLDNMKTLFNNWIPGQPIDISICPEQKCIYPSINDGLTKVKGLATDYLKTEVIKDEDRLFCNRLIGYLQTLPEDDNYKFLDRSPSSGEGSPPEPIDRKDEGLGYN